MAQPNELDRSRYGRRPSDEASIHPSRRSPIDLVHLARQTAGDVALEIEVLGLLVIQIERVRPVIEAASEIERKRLAHALNGAARNLGAFPLADAAERLEHAPGEQSAMDGLLSELDHTRNYARALASA